MQNLEQQLAEKGRMLVTREPRSLVSRCGAGPQNGGRGGRAHHHGAPRRQGAGGLRSRCRHHGEPLHPSRTDPRLSRRGGLRSSATARPSVSISFMWQCPLAGGAMRIAVPLLRDHTQVNYIRRQDPGEHGAGVSPGACSSPPFSRAGFRAALPPSWPTPWNLPAATSAPAWNWPAAANSASSRSTLNETAAQPPADRGAVAARARRAGEAWSASARISSSTCRTSCAPRSPPSRATPKPCSTAPSTIPEHNIRFLGIIRHNSERLARITEDLLTLSRIEQKRQKFEFEPRRVHGLLQDAIDLVRPIAAKQPDRAGAGGRAGRC